VSLFNFQATCLRQAPLLTDFNVYRGYLILALWGTGPTERYEQDRTFMMIGMVRLSVVRVRRTDLLCKAIRMALDLNLHRKSRTTFPVGSVQDKEARNRERTWM